jgi:hypothetical protein
MRGIIAKGGALVDDRPGDPTFSALQWSCR